MKKYYAIYPGPEGLVAITLGTFANFDDASDADDQSVETMKRESSIWIADDNDMKWLYATIRREMKYNA
jgi:hypothetical protein